MSKARFLKIVPFRNTNTYVKVFWEHRCDKLPRWKLIRKTYSTEIKSNTWEGSEDTSIAPCGCLVHLSVPMEIWDQWRAISVLQERLTTKGNKL